MCIINALLAIVPRLLESQQEPQHDCHHLLEQENDDHAPNSQRVRRGLISLGEERSGDITHTVSWS